MEEFLYDNPFLNEQVVSDPERLVGRGDLLTRTYRVVAADGSISLVGPPRIGKGSLLYCLRFHAFQQRYGGVYREKLHRCIFIFVDLRIYAQRNWDGFFNRLNKEIVTQSQETLNLAGIPAEGSEGFTALVDEITDRGYRLVLALDSFEKLRDNERLSGLLPMFLRSESARVSYVVASTIPLNKVFLKEPLSSPFYNIFPNCEEVGALTPTDACSLIIGPFKDAKVPFSEEEIAWILKQAGGHPCFLQRVCRVLFDMKAPTPMTPVNPQKAEEAVYQALYPHFIGLWHGMDERQQEQLTYELRKQETPAFYGSALFRHFVEAESQGETVIQLEEIKNALKILSDLSELGKNRLRRLKVVQSHLNGHGEPSLSEIGLAIRTALFDAWECLKGQGVRNDSTPDWEAYNILYYSHFKHHMQSEHIAARLGMTKRTYFRRKDAALNKLLQALQELEDAAQ